mmetsp:Transcript_608/g.1038  ORF Transcript_608/g.1038 Transcript_608/m.1038 type:complete len:119 (+) Transcript_608:120-476(+)
MLCFRVVDTPDTAKLLLRRFPQLYSCIGTIVHDFQRHEDATAKGGREGAEVGPLAGGSDGIIIDRPLAEHKAHRTHFFSSFISHASTSVFPLPSAWCRSWTSWTIRNVNEPIRPSPSA